MLVDQWLSLRASGYGQDFYQPFTVVVLKLLLGGIAGSFQVSRDEPRPGHHTRCCNPNRPEGVIKEESIARSDCRSARARKARCRHSPECKPENVHLGSRRWSGSVGAGQGPLGSPRRCDIS